MSDGAARGLRMADLLKSMVARGASDIHLQAGAAAPPAPRRRPDPVRGRAAAHARADRADRVGDDERVAARAVRHRHELDFAFTIPAVARFRCNVMRQRGSVGWSCASSPTRSRASRRWACRPAVVSELASQPRGLVLVTGPTGSGKSTTLAAMVDFINRRFPKNVITIEDPIEFLHRNQQSLVIQREIGLDTPTSSTRSSTPCARTPT
jgi:twitching motility protein PilT